MAIKLVVVHDFTVTKFGKPEKDDLPPPVESVKTYTKGDEITDGAVVQEIVTSEHEHHVVKVTV